MNAFFVDAHYRCILIVMIQLPAVDVLFCGDLMRFHVVLWIVHGLYVTKISIPKNLSCIRIFIEMWPDLMMCWLMLYLNSGCMQFEGVYCSCRIFTNMWPELMLFSLMLHLYSGCMQF